jgi:transposase
MHYHERSNVESTFSAMKRQFGETIRSKAPTAEKRYERSIRRSST